MANTAKPAFDYKAHQQALAQFTEMLENHTWSFEADSYYELGLAQALEIDLFKHAQFLGIQGVDEYVYQRGLVLERMKSAAFERGMQRQKESMESTVDYYKKQLEETRTKYMKPIDFFMEKLEKHDWYYHFSDDAGVYRRGKAAEETLAKEAKEGGPEFEAALAAAHKRVVDNIKSK